MKDMKEKIVRSKLIKSIKDTIENPEYDDRSTKEIVIGKPNMFLKRIVDVLSNNEEFKDFDNSLQCFGNMGTRFSYEEVAVWLLQRASKTNYEQAVDELLEYVESDHFPIYKVMWLTGLFANEAIEITDGIWLVGIWNFPVEHIREMFSPSNSALFLGLHPEAVLIKIIDHPKKHIKNNEQMELETEIVDFQVYEDLRLCMTLIKKDLFGVQAIGTSLIPPEFIPNRSGISYSGHDYRNVRMGQNVIELEIQTLRDIYYKFSSLTEEKKSKLRIVLSRMNEYALLENPVDKAISIRILLESLFLDDSDRGELGFQLALRISRKYGKTTEERENIFKDIKKVYSISSSAVHNGYLKDKDSKQSRELFKSTIVYIRLMVSALLNDEVIDWKKFVLE